MCKQFQKPYTNNLKTEVPADLFTFTKEIL